MSLEDTTSAELVKLQMDLASNPATRKSFLGLVKQVRPDLPIPELDVDERTNQLSAQMQERLDKFEQEQQRRDSMAELNKRRETIVSKGIVGADEVEAVEALMLEKGITNHETAAEHFKLSKQQAEPTPSTFASRPFQHLGLKDYFKDPKGTARTNAEIAMREFRTGGQMKPAGL